MVGTESGCRCIRWSEEINKSLSNEWEINPKLIWETKTAFQNNGVPFFIDESIGNMCVALNCHEEQFVNNLCRKHYEKSFWWKYFPDIKPKDRIKFFKLQSIKLKKEFEHYSKIYELAANVQARMKFRFLINLRKKALKKIEEELNCI